MNSKKSITNSIIKLFLNSSVLNLKNILIALFFYVFFIGLSLVLSFNSEVRFESSLLIETGNYFGESISFSDDLESRIYGKYSKGTEYSIELASELAKVNQLKLRLISSRRGVASKIFTEVRSLVSEEARERSRLYLDSFENIIDLYKKQESLLKILYDRVAKTDVGINFDIKRSLAIDGLAQAFEKRMIKERELGSLRQSTAPKFSMSLDVERRKYPLLTSLFFGFLLASFALSVLMALSVNRKKLV